MGGSTTAISPGDPNGGAARRDYDYASPVTPMTRVGEEDVLGDEDMDEVIKAIRYFLDAQDIRWNAKST